MRQQQPHLSDFFAKARSEPAVTSEGEIEQLLDAADLHGRQSAQQQGMQTMKPIQSQHTNRKQRIRMGSIAALLFGTIISVGVVFFGPDTPTNNAPALAGTTAEQTEHTTANVAPHQPLPVGILPIAVPNGRGDEKTDERTVEIPVDKKKKEEAKDKVGQEISKEFQSLVENYWVEKINDYKARIDGMLSSADREELDRLRVRWALTDQSNSLMAFAAQMEMQGTDTEGQKTKIEASLGNANQMPQVQTLNSDGKPTNNMSFSVSTSTKNSKVIIAGNTEEGTNSEEAQTNSMYFFQNDQNLDPTQLENMQGGKEDLIIAALDDQDNDVLAVNGKGDHTIVVRRSVVTSSTEKNSEEEDSNVLTIDKHGDHTVIVRRNGIEDDSLEEDSNVLTIDKHGDHTVIVRRNGIEDDSLEENTALELTVDDGEKFSMTSLMGMLKSVISSDNSESSRIMVATWDIADAHRTQLDDLKATVLNDVAVFTALMRERMQSYVAEHGDELPAEMRESMTENLNAQQDENTKNLLKTLEPIYNVVLEPMLLLYNGSDINGMLTSAIAEPVAGITLEANSTLKQSYPNPASAEATIEYALQEPSTATTLRLFDAQGEEVRNIALGAQDAGNHQTKLDLRDLPAGTYLYHLTIGTARGGQVFSKTMQIVR